MASGEEIAWCRNMHRIVKNGGTWAVPRSGLVFKRTKHGFKLAQILDGFDKAEQAAEYYSIKEHFADAGIKVTL